MAKAAPDTLSIRLASHGLDAPRFDSPRDLIAHFGCIQAQDTRQSRWVIASRIEGATDASIKASLARGEIVRTWPMRGTLHYTDPRHVRPLLELCAAKTLSGFPKRRAILGISDAHAEKALALMQKGLRGKTLSRTELGALLEKGDIPMQTQWVYHLACYAATKGIICFGPPDGDDDTFVLLDEWVPAAKRLPREAQLAEIARMYVRGHGPATADDLAWWTGLGKGDCTKALAAIASECEICTLPNGKDAYFYAPRAARAAAPRIRLLGGFDEYFLGYKDRSPVADVAHHSKLFTSNGIFFPLVVEDGRVIGSWKREIKKDTVRFTFSLLPGVAVPPKALHQECARYTAFLDKKDFVVV